MTYENLIIQREPVTRTIEIREAVLALNEALKPVPQHDPADETRLQEAMQQVSHMLGSEEAAQGIADALARIQRAG
jgi:hypothetical protein